MPTEFISVHRPVPGPTPGSVDPLLDTDVGVRGRHAAFADDFGAVAKMYADRLEMAFWNGDPKFHSGFAFDEVALILAELSARITALEP